MMTIELITRKRAVQLTKVTLPYGLHWYQVAGLQFFPRFGDFKVLVAGDDGLMGVIGKRKQTAMVAKGKAA